MNPKTAFLCICGLLKKYLRKSPVHHWYQKDMQRKLLTLYFLYKRIVKREDEKRIKQERRIWVRPIFMPKRRFLQSASDNLIPEMIHSNDPKYFNFLRISPVLFEKLLQIIEPKITKQYVVRDPISPRTRLEITLRYLASGDSIASVSYVFRVGNNTVSTIISETCQVIWEELKEKIFLNLMADNWCKVAREFEALWNYPLYWSTVLDGKHVDAPPNSGSTYYNYKGRHSINLIAISDANYCFLELNIGAEGRRSDGGVFRNSDIDIRFDNKNMDLPEPTQVGVNGPKLPYVLVADESFALTPYMMRPFPRSKNLNFKKMMFNYRLSRARRVVESAFGLLASRWRIYRKPISASLATAVKIVQATTALHNFIMQNELVVPISERVYSRNIGEDNIALSHRDAFTEIDVRNTNAFDQYAAEVRYSYADFFMNSGALEWQWDKALCYDF